MATEYDTMTPFPAVMARQTVTQMNERFKVPDHLSINEGSL